jgi:hypothetical protein
LTRSWPLDWRGYFEQGIKWDAPLAFGGFTLCPTKLRGCGSSWPKVWTLDLAFGGFTLCPTKGTTYCILLVIFSPFLWTLNKVWPLNPTASRLGQPQCEATLRPHMLEGLVRKSNTIPTQHLCKPALRLHANARVFYVRN